MVAPVSSDAIVPLHKQEETQVIACMAPYGKGGLGQHFAEIVDAARSQGHLVGYYSRYARAGDSLSQAIPTGIASLLPYTPLRYSPSWQNHLQNEAFDLAMAKRLPLAQKFWGFGGQSLRTFRRARALGYQVLLLEAANSHVNNVMRQHQKAIRQFGIEGSWLNWAQQQKTLREYDMADVIYVASEYTRQSLLQEGIPEQKLRQRTLRPHPRFQPPVQQLADGRFRVAYCGSLTVMKGIPILVEAFSRIPDPEAELILIGGWATRGMRNYIQSWMAKDRRIRLSPGDPLPHLQSASVYVHPTYEDGFAYSAVEALACGVPVIVTEDTGMKDYVRDGVNGYIVPTGSWEALLDKLIACREAPLKGGLL